MAANRPRRHDPSWRTGYGDGRARRGIVRVAAPANDNATAAGRVTRRVMRLLAVAAALAALAIFLW